jgi:hypothetical protein
MEHGHDSPLQIDVSWDGAVATVTVAGEPDITTATGLTGRLLAVAARHPARLVLDLSGLAFVDVAGARELDDVHTLLQIRSARYPEHAAPTIAPTSTDATIQDAVMVPAVSHARHLRAVRLSAGASVCFRSASAPNYPDGENMS